MSDKRPPTKTMVRCVDCGRRIHQREAYNMVTGTPGHVCGPCVQKRYTDKNPNTKVV